MSDNVKPITMSAEMLDAIRGVLSRQPEHVSKNSKLLLAEVDALRARVAELEAALADERKHAAFGARAFEAFWCDGEPGDLDAGDLQRMALDCGLLRHVDASDGPGPHCEWCEDDMGAGDECSCLKPTTDRRAKEDASE